MVQAAAILGNVTAVVVGPYATEPLGQAIFSLGAERVLRMWEPELADLDYLGLGMACAEAARTILALGDARTHPPAAADHPFLIVASDDSTISPAIAERLGLGHVGRVCRIEEQNSKQVQFQRFVGPSVRRYGLGLPAVLCVSPTDVEGAFKTPSDAKTVENLSLNDVGLRPGELLHRRRFVPTRPTSSPGARLGTFASIDALLERLRADGLVNEA